MFNVDKLGLLDDKLKELGFKFVSVDIAGYKTGKMVMMDRYD
jgi:PP-loop superfamily ATP-utilizing enzyme